MNIVDANSAPLTNSEVAQVLLDRGSEKPTSKALPVERKVFEYLQEATPGVRSRQQLQAFVEAARGLGLTEAEARRLVDAGPTLHVELSLLISGDTETRFPEGGEATVEGILALVKKHLRS